MLPRVEEEKCSDDDTNVAQESCMTKNGNV